MGFNFKESALKATLISPLMEGREQSHTEDIIKTYPNGVTINGFDLVHIVDSNGEIKDYPIIVIAEDNNIYFNGGRILYNICKEWSDAYNGDINSANNDLKSSGGVKARLSLGKTKNGNNITKVVIL